MLFNSGEFIVFFAVVLGIYMPLRRRPVGRKVFLLLCSYWFYMAWNPPFALLLVFSTVLDFVAGRRIGKSAQRRTRVAWLVASCVGNLGVLAFFKYGDFLLSNVWTVFPIAAEYPSFFENIVLPIGISFYTFQSMSYTIDVFRDERDCENSLLDFALYVAFFPQLIAGPILRAREFLPQLKVDRGPTSEDVLAGVDQAARGMGKKLLLADPLGAYVDIIYAAPEQFGAVNHLLAVYAFAFQIYFDFSGYSDIAIGTARILGYRVPVNFRLPYLACGPSDFWTRWHISLSSWLRDYLYVSLGGNRSGRWKTYRNLLFTMFLGGLWHGAAWGFIIWGALHGLWLALHRFAFRDSTGFRVPKAISIFLTFHVVCLGWIFFRSQHLPTALTVLRQLLDFETSYYSASALIYLLLALSVLTHLLGASTYFQKKWDSVFFGVKALWYASIMIVLFLPTSERPEFIYFQF